MKTVLKFQRIKEKLLRFRILINVFIRKIIKIFLYLIAIIAFSYLFAELILPLIMKIISNGEIFNFGIAVFAPLAVTVAFSGLMYNRAKAVSSKSIRFRSIYLAERLLEASVNYTYCLVTSFICYLIVSEYSLNLNFSGTVRENQAFLIVFVPSFFFVSFVVEVLCIFHGMGIRVGGRRPKDVAMKIRRLV